MQIDKFFLLLQIEADNNLDVDTAKLDKNVLGLNFKPQLFVASRLELESPNYSDLHDL